MPSRCRVEVTLLSRERGAPAPEARDAGAQVIVVQRTALGTSRATRSGLRLAMERQRQRARSWMTGPAREVEPGYSRALDTTFGHPYPDRSRSGAWFPNPAQLNDGPPRKRRAVRFQAAKESPSSLFQPGDALEDVERGLGSFGDSLAHLIELFPIDDAAPDHDGFDPVGVGDVLQR